MPVTDNCAWLHNLNQKQIHTQKKNAAIMYLCMITITLNNLRKILTAQMAAWTVEMGEWYERPSLEL